MPLPPPLRGARASFIFLTRIPVGGENYRDADWRWSTGWFPFVGLTIGTVLAGVWSMLSPLGAWPCAFIVIGLAMMITGGFHEDGLADTADALGGAFNREKLFLILKDSRVGAFGAMALFVSLGLRAALLAELNDRAPVALILTECLARVAPICLMTVMPYVTADAQAKSRQVTRARWPQALLALSFGGLSLAIAFQGGYLSQQHLIGLVLAGCITTAYCGWRFHRRAGGITGDFLGALQQLTQLVMLATLLWPVNN